MTKQIKWQRHHRQATKARGQDVRAQQDYSIRQAGWNKPMSKEQMRQAIADAIRNTAATKNKDLK